MPLLFRHHAAATSFAHEPRPRRWALRRGHLALVAMVTAPLLPTGIAAPAAHAAAGLSPITNDITTWRGATVRRALVVPVLYKNQPISERVSLTTVRTNVDKIVPYYQQSSGGYDSGIVGPSEAGDINLTFAMRGWQEVGIERPAGSNICDDIPEMKSIAAIDQALGINRATENYDHYIYLLPCLSRVTGATGDSGVPSSTVRIFKDFVTTDNIGHELGHSLGLSHGQYSDCRVDGLAAPLSPTASSTDCTTDEYGASSDWMSHGGYDRSGNQALLSGFHRVRLGFLPVKSVTQVAPAEGVVHRIWDSTTRLAPSGTTPQTQLLRILRPTRTAAGDVRGAYYLGIRGGAPGFQELSAGHPLRTGVEIQAASTSYTSKESAREIDAQAVAARIESLPADGRLRSNVDHPEGATRYGNDFTLKPGRSLYDPVEDFTITTRAVGQAGVSTYADVTVESGPPRSTTSISLASRRLTIRATAGVANNIAIATVGTRLAIADYGSVVSAPAACTPSTKDPQVATCPLADFDSISIETGDQDDQVTFDNTTTVPATINGGDGNDTLAGGKGDDTLSGGQGQDFLNPGLAGTDTASFADRTAPITFDTRQQGVLATSTDGDDEIAPLRDYMTSVTNRFDRIIGGRGNDTIHWTYEDNAAVTGGKTVDGGDGVDTISITGDNNTIVSRDGTPDGPLNCGGGTGSKALAESLDTQITGCGTPILATAPTIVTGPAEGAVVKASPAPVFTFKMYASPEAFSCKVDSGAWASCPASFSIPNLTNGPHTLRVRQNPGTVETIRNFTVDTVAPAAPTILTAPSGRVNGRYAKVTFSAPGSHTARCYLNYQGKECASPRSYADLAEGDYVFSARSVDEAGNVSTSSTVASWTVDRTAPPAPQVGGPTGTITDPRPIFTFSSSVADLGSHECRLVPVGGTAPVFRACTGSGTDQPTANLADGEYRFEARAKDAAGNTGASATRTVWVVASGGTVRVNASELEIIAFADRVNTLKVRQSGATYVIDDTVSLQAQAGCSQVTIKQVTCPTTGVGSLWLEAGDRDDDIDVQIPITTYLNGDAGNDTLRGVGTGTDYFYGGTGSDTVTYTGTTTAVTVSLAAATAGNGGPVGGPQDFFATDVENLTGGSGNDTLTGRTAAVSTLRGGAGTDTLRAGAGGSILDGGDGNDSLTGAAGADTADYRSRTDALTINLTTGQASGIATAGGTDTIASTIDTLLSGSGSDTLTDGPGDKRIEAGGGADTIIDAAGNDTYLGGDSSDTFRTVTGGGNDTFDGGANVDTLDLSTFTAGVTISRDGVRNDGIPGATADLDNVLPGIESFKTGSGNDTINAGTGMTLGTFTLGAGTDTVSYATSAEPLEISAFSDKLSAWVGPDTNTLVEAERIIGTNSDDFVAAGTGGTADRPVTIEGGAGNDEIVGGSKADVLIGGTGLDVLRGGDGNDRLETKDTIGGETADCGLGDDSALTDGTDTRTSCETVL